MGMGTKASHATWIIGRGDGDTLRLVHLRGHYNIPKRVLLHDGALNPAC